MSGIGATGPAVNHVLQIPDVLWKEFEAPIREEIAREFQEAKSTAPSSHDNIVWMEGFLRFIGRRSRPAAEKRSWLVDNITGLMVVSAFLALAFGVLGVLGLKAEPNAVASGFLDIAKIFAGALVGAAGASVVVKRTGA